MIKKIYDIRKIEPVLPAQKSRRQGFGRTVRLVHFLERNRMAREVVNKHFYSYSLFGPIAVKNFLSSAAAERHLGRIYERFYLRKLETERHYYRSKPTMAYKMLKSVFNYDYRKETELVYRKPPPAPAVNPPPANYEKRESGYGARMIESGRAEGLTEGDLAMITESVLSALERQRLREERRKGK
jgi:hypothetical protein